MIYKITKTIPAETEGVDSNLIELEVDDLVPFSSQPTEFKTLFSSISQNNIAAFDNVDIILFPESDRVIISKK
ncbi:MAG: hypothetical protein ACK5KT_11430 [Dysgonomonas sp.]